MIREANRQLAPWNNRLLKFLTPSYLWTLPAIWRYAITLVIVIIATALRAALIPWMGISAPHTIGLHTNSRGAIGVINSG